MKILVALAMPTVCQGALVVDIVEDGSDVIFTVTGGVDVTGLTSSGTIAEGTTPQIQGAPVSSILLRGSGATLQLYAGAAATVSQFSGGPIGLTSLVGGPLPTVLVSNNGFVSVSADRIGALPTTVSSAIWPNTSFASLGIADGVVSGASWVSGSGPESITFRTGSAVVPEPSSCALLALSVV
ncbi:hypothetical protein N9230_03605, partial [Akkermansiaceae bacterium]|nr:hypothetical protein [Akkermansiaceae bacterium]